ncbi:helix-turn-helix domain-containing protein [Haloglomus irregulare]|jgi:predicted transcriptional regulator|uniref:helix-turn-helix domain-containing protein n=1 Tax=Haloglomus irregulare TaxID=2234134 RepID=UPI00163D7152|nr:helix-turn-helix domain-containing protein [Haloglomus irregulare]
MTVASVREDLERDLRCLDLLGCVHGLNERDQMVFQLLQQAEGGLTVDDIADRLDCGRSTAYRSISRLHEAGVVEQEQINYDNGGYYYVYCPRTPEEVAHEMQRLLNDWYADIGQLIQEFEDRYSRNSEDRENQPLQSCP